MLLCTPPSYRAQCEYGSECWGEERYQAEMQEVTAAFSRLSCDLLSLVAWFRESGLSEAAAVLEALQLREKEKLQLVCVCRSSCALLLMQILSQSSLSILYPQTVQFQVKKQEHRRKEKERRAAEEGEEEDEVVCGAAVQEERELRKRLAEVEGAIAGLLSDLRFECEPQLLTAAPAD